MNKSSIDVVTERLDRLERQCRRWRWAGAVDALALAAAVTASVVECIGGQREILTASLSIVDENGRPTIRLGSTSREKGHHFVEFLAESGEPLLAMGIAGGHGPFVQMNGRDGRNQIILDAADGKGVGIRLMDAKRNSGVMLGTNPDGITGLGLMSTDGKVILEIGLNPDGSALFVIRDSDGRKELLRLPKP